MELKAFFVLAITLVLVIGCSKSSDPSTTLTNTSGTLYKDQIYSNVTTISNITYGSNTTYGGTTKTLTLDLYTASENPASKKPLLILIAGGGFSANTDKSSFKDVATKLAYYGYSVASINYRTYDGTGTMSNSILKQIILQGMQDAKAAIRFFRKDAATTNSYKIDPDKIFLGGHSAGSMVALHAVYLDDLTEADATFQGIINNNGGLDGNSGNAGYSSDVKGCINLSGSLLDKNYITANNTPLLGIYGTSDTVMPFLDGTFSLPTISSISVSGSSSLNERAKAVNSSSTLNAISGGDHFASADASCSTCISSITTFMYNLIQ